MSPQSFITWLINLNILILDVFRLLICLLVSSSVNLNHFLPLFDLSGVTLHFFTSGSWYWLLLMRPHRLCCRSFVFKTQSALQYGSFQHQYKLSQKNNRYQDLQTVSSSSSSPLYHTIHVCVEPRLLSHPPPKPAANECEGFVLTADAGLYIVL